MERESLSGEFQVTLKSTLVIAIPTEVAMSASRRAGDHPSMRTVELGLETFVHTSAHEILIFP